MQSLNERSNNCCELCKLAGELSVYTVKPENHQDNEILICASCLSELQKGTQTNSQYWRFLTETMWSEIPAVQVMAWRVLSVLKNETWAADSLDMLYMDDETLNWAKAGLDDIDSAPAEVHKDSLGAELQNGDTVVLTRSLDVKGSSLNAKMGTVVKNIRLVADNTDQVEGKIDGQLIVILTKYLRKQKS
ncbi:PhnA domain-containing protein [Mucilaginibacter sp. Bleaf8]|uniref:PhnA domain-containing protein n=1 Tax=Mucilaginibacter sp. Bleaf8 TaxID=2834430 RepID=UPI001BCB2BE3|nr:alkylphosphonate utilization protein [Mucilaginibacter sp. Bleaf8]MBS7563285.1 PhnA domain-containing protein [Mucilaginibacter sp. Bleaf8]